MSHRIVWIEKIRRSRTKRKTKKTKVTTVTGKRKKRKSIKRAVDVREVVHEKIVITRKERRVQKEIEEIIIERMWEKDGDMIVRMHHLKWEMMMKIKTDEWLIKRRLRPVELLKRLNTRQSWPNTRLRDQRNRLNWRLMRQKLQKTPWLRSSATIDLVAKYALSAIQPILLQISNFL